MKDIIMSVCGRFTVSLDTENEWFDSFPQKSKLVNYLLAREFHSDSKDNVKDPDMAEAYKMVKAKRLIKGGK